MWSVIHRFFDLMNKSPNSSSSEMSWGKDANCYAYAVNCKEPRNGTFGGALPGMSQGLLVEPVGRTVQFYRDALIKGALADGLMIAPGAVHNPPPEEKGFYLVALICKVDGFHWLRRDENTKEWSWKDGNKDTVKLSVYENNSKRLVRIKDNTLNSLASLLSKSSEEKYLNWRYHDMEFAGFFRVPVEGLAVEGRPESLMGKRTKKAA